MDLIYQNAHTCIGLLNTSWERRHWNVILEECEHVMGRPDRPRRGTSPEVERSNSRFRQTYIEAMAEAVLGLLTDRWNTRAWILQEAFVSADRMLLLFPRNGMNTDGWYLVCNEKCITEVAINLDLIQQGLEASIFPLLAPTDDARSNRVFFDMVRYFYPRSMDTYGRVGVGNFYIRRRCDAATALAYLNRRSLARVADRIAILANLCGYEQRLNTFELEKGQQSLSVSMLALSLANGDLTLLVPEMYRTPAGVLPGKCANHNCVFKDSLKLITTSQNFFPSSKRIRISAGYMLIRRTFISSTLQHFYRHQTQQFRKILGCTNCLQVVYPSLGHYGRLPNLLISSP